MKRWHMEGIVNYADTTSHKLALPNTRKRFLLPPRYTKRVRREFFLVRLCRYVIGGFLALF